MILLVLLTLALDIDSKKQTSNNHSDHKKIPIVFQGNLSDKVVILNYTRNLVQITRLFKIIVHTSILAFQDSFIIV